MASNAFTAESRYDVFLSYNSADHNVVENIARKLRDEGLEPFLDRWYLAPGMRWRSKLEDTLSSCKAVAIFVGPGEMGSWQQREVDVALDLQSRSSNLPVIPVLLPGCEPPLGFLRQLTWVDLRTQTIDRGISILGKAARGEAPGPDLQRGLDSVRASICPYRGLLHFREEDAPFFFGREAAIDKLASALQCQPFVAVVGASGSGKSSVVRAGLVPRLRRDRSTAWEIVLLVPTDQPLKALAMALVPLLEPTLSEVDRLGEACKLAEHFNSGTVSVYDIVRRVLYKQTGTDRLLIVVDQFEELYTLTTDDHARRRFLDELLAASTCSGSKLTVAITLRGDFVGKAFSHRSLSDRLQGAQVNLGPMTSKELAFVIRNPAERMQLEFESGLVGRIVDAVGDEPGNLPLLEFVLNELWENRRGQLLLNETYDAMGELKGALAKKAGDFFRKLSDGEQRVLRRVFLRIVRPSESGEDTRRRAGFAELPPEGLDLVVELANERLLVTNRSAGDQEQTVEVAHEALISNWGTLRGWVNEDREFLLWRERLGALHIEYKRVQGNDDALLRGPLLIEAQKWLDQRSQDLSDQERIFIDASRELRERLAREDKERQERELKAARKLAETERQRAEMEREGRRRLRYFIIALVGLLLLTGLVATIAVFEGISARVADEKTGVIGSQASVSLARYLLDAGKDAQALAHLAQALRLNPKNYEAAALTGMLLTQTGWALPVVDLTRNARISGSLHIGPDGQRVVTVSDDGVARLWDAATGKVIGEPMQHGAPINSVQYSPDSRQVVTFSNDGTARVWDAATGKKVGEPMKHGGSVDLAQFSADGKRLVTASNDGTMRLWNSTTGKAIGEPMRHEGAVISAQFSPDGQRLVTASKGGTARLWDAASAKAIGEPMKHEGAVNSVQFSPDGQRLLTAPKDGTARLWDAASAKAIGEPIKHEGGVNSAQFSPDGQRLVTASNDGTVRLWDAASAKAIGEPMKHEGAVNSAQFSPDGRRLVTASVDQTARLWDSATGKAIGEPMKHGGAVNSARFSPDGQRVLTTSNDRTVLWDATTGKAIGEPMQHGDRVNSAQFSPDGQRVLTTSNDRTVLWDATTGKAIDKPMQHGARVESARFSPDGRQVLTTSNDGVVRWDAATGKPLCEPLKHETEVLVALFSSDGRRVVTFSANLSSLFAQASPDGLQAASKLWDALTGKQIGEPMKLGVSAFFWGFSPDGRRVLSVSVDGTVQLYDAATGKATGEPMRHGAIVKSAQFSPDCQRVVTVSRDGTAGLWDAASGKAIGELKKYEAGVNSAQFSPDGRRLATASEDGTARLWDSATGKRIGEPMKHESSVNSAQFSPDGRRVVTTSADQTARLWDAATGKKIGEPMKHWIWVDSAQFSPDSQRVVTIAGREGVLLWDAATGKKIGEPIGHGASVNSVQFSPDGRRMVSISDRRTVLWDAGSGKEILDLKEEEVVVNSAQFSPDGQHVVTASKDGTAQLWDAATGKKIGEAMKHGSSVNLAQFSPDGRWVVTASDDGTARLWVATTGKAIGEPMKHGAPVKSAQFSPDGHRVFTVSKDKAVQSWDLPTISSKDSADDVLLLADLAEASGRVALQTVGSMEIQSVLSTEQRVAIREKIALRFVAHSSKLTPLQRFLKWSVSEHSNRTISPLSELTVAEWVENRINEGTFDSLRAAIQVDPANARLAAHFGWRLADYAIQKGTDPVDALRSRAEAEFQTHRAMELAPDNDEVKKLRGELVELLQLGSE